MPEIAPHFPPMPRPVRYRASSWTVVAAALLIGFALVLSPGNGAAAAPGAAIIAAVPVTAVLVAGDGSIRVFDNAVAALRNRLLQAAIDPGRIRVLTSTPSLAQPGMRDGMQAAIWSRVTRRISDLAPRPGEACLVFVTSHGAPGDGLVLSLEDEFLSPRDLDEALSGGCATAPTVVIASGCYSGDFAHGVMARANRIVLTASRSDRPSFGCDADSTYTFFDECLLGSLDHAVTWQAVYHLTRSCVAAQERRMHATPSHPQAFFGRNVARLATPWASGDQRTASPARLSGSGIVHPLPASVPVIQPVRRFPATLRP